MKSNQELIIEKVWQLFANVDFDEVMAILDDYGHESWHWAKEDIQLAALKMSNGKLERLRSYMKTARADYRNVFLVAREPNVFRVEMTATSRVSDAELALAQLQDKEQFDSWLAGNHVFVCEHCSGVGVVPEERQEDDAAGTSVYQRSNWVKCSYCDGTGKQPFNPQNA